MIEPYSVQVSNRVNFDYNEWCKKQSQADNLEGIKEASLYLLGIMKKAEIEEKLIVSEMKKANRWYKRNKGYYRYNKPEKPTGAGFLNRIYKNNYGFFYFDGDVRDEIIEYLFSTESIKYIGRVKHQSSLHKAWIMQEDESEKQKRLKLKEELKTILNDKKRKKRIIKSALKLKLNFGGDYSISTLMNNDKFAILTEGLENFSVFEKNKWIVVCENINHSFIDSIKELEKENIIRMNKFGWVFPQKKLKTKCWEEIEKDIAFDYIREV